MKLRRRREQQQKTSLTTDAPEKKTSTTDKGEGKEVGGEKEKTVSSSSSIDEKDKKDQIDQTKTTEQQVSKQIASSPSQESSSLASSSTSEVSISDGDVAKKVDTVHSNDDFTKSESSQRTQQTHRSVVSSSYHSSKSTYTRHEEYGKDADEDPSKRQFRTKRRFPYRKRECYFKKNNVTYIDFKDVDLLSRFISKNGRITPPRFTGTSKIYQRKLALAIKRARYMALIPYIDTRR